MRCGASLRVETGKRPLAPCPRLPTGTTVLLERVGDMGDVAVGEVAVAAAAPLLIAGQLSEYSSGARAFVCEWGDHVRCLP